MLGTKFPIPMLPIVVREGWGRIAGNETLLFACVQSNQF
jgi:hypothetical protein